MSHLIITGTSQVITTKSLGDIFASIHTGLKCIDNAAFYLSIYIIEKVCGYARIGSETAGPISMKLSGNLRIDLASNPVKFGDDRSTPIFELSNCQIQLLFTIMIFYCWVYMGVDNDLHPLEKRIEENEYREK
ncbi:jg15979 [Pararge aegeria aegeria]|uniref:Jg15979 protein n=1 Tax=Pararge aegeria aegeria TaxID=348720 RepID=A0A8S4SNX1_9NEOP|nr:jg15979 [Pararge aegeria aegeria]